MRPYVQRSRAQRRDRTGSAIETATLRLLRQRGYTALRLEEVAQRSAVALRTLYLHARSKEDLVQRALRHRASALARRVERWQPPPGTVEVLDDLVALHERTYRAERQLLEALVDSGAPGGSEVLRSLDRVRLVLIERAVRTLDERGALRQPREDSIALAHALLAFPTWRAALTGPAGRRAPRLIAGTLRVSLLA